MSEIYRINVSLLKSYNNKFNNEKDNFKNSTYRTFTSSYLKSCTDYNVVKMYNNLDKIYLKINKAYNNIDKWWTSYIQNVEGLESALSNKNRVGNISEGSIRSYVRSLPDLENYKVKFSKMNTSSVLGSITNAILAKNKVKVFNDPFSSLYADYDVESVSVNSVIANEVSDKLSEVISSVSAKASSMGSRVVSLVSNIVTNATYLFNETKAKISNSVQSIWNNVKNWWSNKSAAIDVSFNEVGARTSIKTKNILADASSWWSDLKHWFNNDFADFAVKAKDMLFKVLTSTGATVGTFAISLVEGLLQFGESIVDLLALAGTGVASIVTGVLDGIQAISGAVNGQEWTSSTKSMWEKTKGFVSKKCVNGWFDKFYDNAKIGNFFKDNAIWFDGVRGIGSGIGNLSGVVLLTICTFGVGGAAVSGGSLASSIAATSSTQMAITAAAGGIGRGTQDAWADGAGILKGLGTGALSGIWEGLQFYLGAKINATQVFGEEGIFKAIGSTETRTKILNSLARVIFDGVDGGVEGFVQPLISSIYKDGSYIDIFEEEGGWSNVLTNAASGSILSFVSELFDLSKYFKNSKNMETKVSPEISQAILEIDEVFNEKNLDKILDDLVSNELGVNGRKYSYELFHKLDYDSLPKLVESDEFLKLSQDSNYRVLYRGISGEDSLKFIDQFKNGELYVGGKNARIDGSGIYTTFDENLAKSFVAENGSIMKMLLSDDAKIIDFDIIAKEQQQVLDTMAKQFKKYDSSIKDFDSLFNNLSKITDPADLKKAKFIINTLGDTGCYASIRGFDAINVANRNNLVICNRGKVIMEFDTGIPMDFLVHYDELDSNSIYKKFSMMFAKKNPEGFNKYFSDMDIESFANFFEKVDYDGQKVIINTIDSTNLSKLIKVCSDEKLISLLDSSSYNNWQNLIDALINEEKYGSFLDNLKILEKSGKVPERVYDYMVNDLEFSQIVFLLSKGQIKDLDVKFDVNLNKEVGSKLISGTELLMMFNDYTVSNGDKSVLELHGVSPYELAKGLYYSFKNLSKQNGYNFRFLSNFKFEKFIEENLIETPRGLELLNWAENDMPSKFKKFLGNYVTDKRIEDLKWTYMFWEPDVFAKHEPNPRVMGYNNGNRSYVNLKYSDEIVKSVVSHESLHQISAKENFIDPATGNKVALRGLCVREYDGTDNLIRDERRGFNEATTEFLTELVMGRDYPKVEYCGYQPAINKALKPMLEMDIEGFNIDTLMKGYVNNDITLITTSIDSYVGEVGFFNNKLVPSFDKAINKDEKIYEAGLKELEQLMVEMVLKHNSK